MAGCSAREDEGPTADAGSPGAGGTLVWALAERPAGLDPLFAETASERLVSRQIHEPLVAELSGPFEDVRRVPGLALSVSSSSDGTVWRLRLRGGVRFQDGARFNASAVLANVDRWRATAQGRALIDGALADAPRPDLVRFILAAPDPDFSSRLASPQLGIVSPRALAAAAGTELEPGEAARSGTGPFELRERAAERLLLARDTGWWGSEHGLGPGVDQLEFTVVADPSDRSGMLQEGSVQVAGGLGSAGLARVRADPLLTLVPEPGPGALAVERSVRGIPPGDPAPPLNGAWRTGVGVGQ